ncbi:MAG: phosphotransferase [bacterium]|nr:phosphotransferase [bacterium]
MSEKTLDAQTPWLNTQTIRQAENLLREAGVIAAAEMVTAMESAGQGNMNVTLRAEIYHPDSAGRRSLIIKQARPFVAKYPDIPAPLERMAYEAKFYQFASLDKSLRDRMPQLLATLLDQHAIVLKDLGKSSDGSCLYEQHPIQDFPDRLLPLLDWLAHLHSLSRGQIDSAEFSNLPLRKLNHAHIFALPFQDPAPVDLDRICPGLAAATRGLRTDSKLRSRCLEAGEVYLSSGSCLLHGDFYPGSWLLAPSGAYVIDPEFCFAGPAEFDWGVLLAHLQILGCSAFEQQLRSRLQRLVTTTDWELVLTFAAIEILRRLLGVAQLPLTLDLAERMSLMEWAVEQLK